MPSQTIISAEKPAWARTDWFGAAFWYLNGLAERTFEAQNGPVHSFSFRLKGWDSRLWERAWVNRIALFLRRWAAHLHGVDEETLFGPLPQAEIILTHDVDAISKTAAIRLKQTAFHAFNGVRNFKQGQLKRAFAKSAQATKFFFSADDYWCFEQIIALEEAQRRRSHFYIYGGPSGWWRHPKNLLIDPGYRANQPKLAALLRQLQAEGWTVGLHQSFAAWENAGLMRQERERVEQALALPVTACRQHWLRFSWERTWLAQQEAGLKLDTTLGFNDRPAFRNGAALRFRPWNFATEQPLELEAIPMVLMDSHLYDYGDFSEEQRQAELAYWLDEIRFVGGTATVIWHQRVFSRDYGWGTGFQQLLEQLRTTDF